MHLRVGRRKNGRVDPDNNEGVKERVGILPDQCDQYSIRVLHFTSQNSSRAPRKERSDANKEVI
jgi:hypothetical protein